MGALPNPLGEAEEVIRRSLLKRRGMYDPDDFEDLRSEVMLRLIRRLENREAEPIASLPDYVAMVAFHVVDDYARKRYPDRARLANRIRFTLTRDDRFALWDLGRELVGGLRAWDGQQPVQPPTGLFVDAEDVPDSLLRLFVETQAPVAFHGIVGLFWKPGRPMLAAVTAPPPPARTEIAERLWAEIGELPLRQRIALLLHLRDDSGESALIHLGVPFSDLARTLEMPEEELVAIRESLPLDDNTIAARLGATRQQVINLRKCAKERLSRRIARW